MSNDITLSAERVRERLRYNPDTGYMYHRTSGQGHKRMQEAGYLGPLGYRRIRIDGKVYQAHRLAWLHYYGEWPERDIDHVNGEHDDNRISNMRLITAVGNAQNVHKAASNNRLGILGVRRVRDRYRAQITVGGKTINLGTFDTASEASEAYRAAKRIHHPWWVEQPA